MPHDRLDALMADEVAALVSTGTAKGGEVVVTEITPPRGVHGPRVRLQGSELSYIRMNSNSYLGLAQNPKLVAAEEEAVRRYGVGPGAVRFISGTYSSHTELEMSLADFHGREAAMVFSSAYAGVVSILAALVSAETVAFSDELNHNCIINGLRMTRPVSREVYAHNDMGDLERKLGKAVGAARALVITDGVFSMRGDHAPLDRIMDLARRFDDDYAENVVVIVDDSHGVGAFGKGGRGTEAVTGSGPVDVLIGTLGKAFGVNGGYVAGSRPLVSFLRERAPMYIYSNPITPGEAAAAAAAVELVGSPEGKAKVEHLAEMTRRFEAGLIDMGFETIPGPHPVVPLMVRDTGRTARLGAHLFDNGGLATGLNYPVVPKGDEEIRFQVNASHTPADIDEVLGVLARVGGD